MAKTIIVIPARLGSKRLPRKLMLRIKNKPILQWTIEAAAKAIHASEIWVVTTTNPEDEEILKFTKQFYDVRCFRGEEKDIISRILAVANRTKADIIVSVDAEQPAIKPEYIDRTIAEIENGAPFAYFGTAPIGQTRCYAFTRAILKDVFAIKDTRTDSEWYKLFEDYCNKPSWCVDTQEDFDFIKEAMELGS